MSHLVGNPEDWFSRVAAHVIYLNISFCFVWQHGAIKLNIAEPIPNNVGPLAPLA